MVDTLTYIHSLLLAINKIDQAFKAHFQTNNVLRAVRDKVIPKQGVFQINGKRGSYHFHGIGCKVTMGNLIVNYDYTPPGVCGGFSLYDLHQYIQGRQGKCDLALLENELKQMVIQGLLVYPEAAPNRTLYFETAFWKSII
ncbi:hypothetical protein SAMN05444266_10576 [Chitinophaga jiangningensis]|uniref:DUF6896 domain-containing protein n=1 Tax=Chitinophaga jiangningensis TaxID=1419482 RepID=A0A1M7DP98_9BACT|nr:hypothetical protein [Chitinophaga jiangningensis]SHL81300.1 hypothetical protein SAMN05444266_10576 [Chitinophaga jiangningensis]